MAYTIPKKEVVQYGPEALKTFHLTIYEWIDNLHFVMDPREFLENAEEYIAVAKERFLQASWEGDGDIGLIWIPPFMLQQYANQEAAYGVVVWHVKQVEDGISWLLSPIRLPFE